MVYFWYFLFHLLTVVFIPQFLWKDSSISPGMIERLRCYHSNRKFEAILNVLLRYLRWYILLVSFSNWKVSSIRSIFHLACWIPSSLQESCQTLRIVILSWMSWVNSTTISSSPKYVLLFILVSWKQQLQGFKNIF